ncbi:MAG TPA: LysM peptidoglycan-binding domain-containing protein [Gemmataceae bacterium]|nr:LysM peptidoglycan-binding domain-containing protein [Gemmataceae bacterium]
MPNDAKLGLVVGVGLVIAVAVIFFRKDLTANPPDRATAAAPARPGRLAPRGAPRPARARAMARQHTVQEGDTLAALAERYYGDPARSADLCRANADVLQGAEQPAPGTVLTIPELEPGTNSAR